MSLRSISIRTENVLKKKKTKIIIFIFVFLLLGFTYTRGIMLHDEGYILHAAERITQGELLYKDFFIAYTPLSPIITSLGFLLFGSSILSGRVMAFVASLISILLLYRISALITKNEITRLIPILFFIVWGPMQINFSWPVVYTTVSGLAACYFLLKSKKNKKKYYFLSGIFAAVTFLCKQNFGAAVLVSNIIYIVLNRRKMGAGIIPYLAGNMVPIAITMLFVIATGTMQYAIENYYYYFFKKLIIDGNQATPFITIQSIKNVLKTIFYLFPAIVSIAAIILTYKSNKKYLITPLFTLFYYLAGIRPVTDYVHVIPLLSLSGLPLMMIMIAVKNKRYKFIIPVIFVLFIVFGFYASLFRNYYRWESPLVEHKYTVKNKKLNVLVDAKYNAVIPDLVDYIQKNSKPNEYIFINYYAPSLYFFSERKNPTRFIYLSADVLDDAYQNEVIRNLEVKKVKLIITSVLDKNDNTKITQFIKKNYSRKKIISDFEMWEMKSSN